MNLAIDVHYKDNYAKVVGVAFEWEDSAVSQLFTTQVEETAVYQAGLFYKRELPCILELLKQIDLSTINTIIVDGHCFVNNEKKLGLGGYLDKTLQHSIPIIGIAKKSFYNTNKVSFPVFRGGSQKALFISTIGIDVKFAIDKVLNMHGKYRIPTILKTLDRITKNE